MEEQKQSEQVIVKAEQGFFDKLPHLSRRTIAILAIVLIIAAIPLTIFLSQQQQDIRQRAASDNLLRTDMQYVSSLKDNPNDVQKVQWIDVPVTTTFRLSGTVINKRQNGWLTSYPNEAAIYADEYQSDGRTFVTTHTPGEFTVEGGRKLAVILRVVNTEAEFKDVSLLPNVISPSNLLNTDMRNVASLKHNPNDVQRVQWFPSETTTHAVGTSYTLSGTVNNKQPNGWLQSKPNIAGIYADEYSLDTNGSLKYETTHTVSAPNNQNGTVQFTIPTGRRLAVILRVVNTEAEFKNVSLIAFALPPSPPPTPSPVARPNCLLVESYATNPQNTGQCVVLSDSCSLPPQGWTTRTDPPCTPTSRVSLSPGSAWSNGQTVTITFTAFENSEDIRQGLIRTSIWEGVSDPNQKQGNGNFLDIQGSSGTRTARVPFYVEWYSQHPIGFREQTQNRLVVGVSTPTNTPTPTPTPLPAAPTVTPTATVTPSPTATGYHRSDINHSGCIGIGDFDEWARAFETGQITANTNPDISGNGRVDLLDFDIWYSDIRNPANNSIKCAAGQR